MDIELNTLLVVRGGVSTYNNVLSTEIRMDINTVTIAAMAAVCGGIVMLLLKGALGSKKLNDAKNEAERIVREAKVKAEGVTKEASVEAKDILFKMKSEFEAEAKETRSEMKRAERRLIHKEENIDRKTDLVEKREKEVADTEKRLEKRNKVLERDEKKYKMLLEEQKEQLEKISTLTAEQADYISVHVPKMKETTGLIDRAAFERMKDND